MPKYKSQLMQTLIERGFLYQCTDKKGLDALAVTQGHPVGYIGFDCTAPSLHVGSLVQIMMLRILQKSGGTPVVLMGGGTTKIGDPSDKDKARPILTYEQIEANKNGIKKVFSKFLDFDGPNAAIMADNADWLDKLGYIEFLRDIGKYFTINRMIQLESVKRRLEREQPMTFLEFNYTLLQAYDYLELNRRYGCRLQMGGSDQWGNIVSGADLIRRFESVECYGFTTPLITTALHRKMGKTADGAIWLNASESPGRKFTRSPYDYWQFWRNTEDADVGKFLRLFTDVPFAEIQKLEALEGSEINAAKILLADEATTMLHGAVAARKAFETARKTFAEGGTAAGLPTFEVKNEDFSSLRVLDAVILTELCASKGEVRRHIKAGALKINNKKVNDPELMLKPSILRDGMIKISIGKKKHVLIKPV